MPRGYSSFPSSPFSAMTRANAMAYGPVVGEYGRAQMIGASGTRLGPRDVAISPNLLNQYKMGQTVNIVDAQGNPLGSYRIADTSWYGPGNPTSNTIEFRDVKRSGNVYIDPASGKQTVYPNLAAAPPVTVEPPAPAQGLPPWDPNAPPAAPAPYQPPPWIEPGGGGPAYAERPYDLSTHGDVRFTAADWNRANWAANPSSMEDSISAYRLSAGRFGGGGGGLVMPGKFQ